MTASAAGHLSVTGRATLPAGTTVRFSPALQNSASLPPGYRPPTTSALGGLVVDAVSRQPLAGVQVTVFAANAMALTEGGGRFTLASLNPGDLTLDLSAAGYQGLRLAVTAPAGQFDLGTLGLSPAPSPAGRTLTGRVTDQLTGTVLAGATLSLGNGQAATTDANGVYRFSGLATDAVTITATAVGYLSRQGGVTLPDRAATTLDLALERASRSAIDIAKVTPDKVDYPAYSRITLDVALANGSAQDRSVRLYAVVSDATGQVVEQFPAQRVPLGGDPASALITLPAHGSAQTALSWANGSRPPGRYGLVVQAFDGTTGELLAERDTLVDILPTRAIGGSVEFDPPIAQLAANQPVRVTAKLSNRGNLPLDAGTVAATVALKNIGYQSRPTGFAVETLAQNGLLKYPSAVTHDAGGNLYVLNNSGTEVLKMAPDGQSSKLLSGLSGVQDLDVTRDGSVAYIDSSGRLTFVDAKGQKRSVTTSPNLGGARALKVLDDGRVLAASGSNLYQVGHRGRPPGSSAGDSPLHAGSSPTAAAISTSPVPPTTPFTAGPTAPSPRT